MIGLETREAIITLKEKEVPIRDISRILKVSRNTVRSVLRGKPRSCFLPARTEEIVRLAAELIPRCKGNIVRVRELLKETHGIDIAYSTLTRLVRSSNLEENTPERVGSYSFAPGEETQHDTSPHRLLIAGKTVTAQCAALVLAYSRRAFIQYYPAFTRLEARHFLSQAFCFMGGACQRCVIDNTSVIVAQGAGPDARIAPEMEGFGQIFGTRFVPHRVGDPDRKGYASYCTSLA